MLLFFGLPLLAADWEVGLGFQRSAFEPTLGPRVVGRLGLAYGFILEASAFGRLPTDPVTPLDEALLALAYDGNSKSTLTLPIEVETASFSAHVDWGLRGRPRGDGFWVSPLLLAGVKASLTAGYTATINEEWVDGASDDVAVLSAPTADFRFGPSVGGGAELGVGRWGLDLRMAAALAVDEEPDYGNRDARGDPVPLDKILTTSITWSLNGRVLLGAR